MRRYVFAAVWLALVLSIFTNHGIYKPQRHYEAVGVNVP